MPNIEAAPNISPIGSLDNILENIRILIKYIFYIKRKAIRKHIRNPLPKLNRARHMPVPMVHQRYVATVYDHILYAKSLTNFNACHISIHHKLNNPWVHRIRCKLGKRAVHNEFFVLGFCLYNLILNSLYGLQSILRLQIARNTKIINF